MTAFEGCEVTRTTVERVTIIGPMDFEKHAMVHLFTKGYRVIQSGPYTDPTMRPSVDVSRFRYVAEKELK